MKLTCLSPVINSTNPAPSSACNFVGSATLASVNMNYICNTKSCTGATISPAEYYTWELITTVEYVCDLLNYAVFTIYQ